VTPTGVTFLDHTADVGMDVEAASLEELLHLAALGMLALLRGDEEGAPAGGPILDAAPAEDRAPGVAPPGDRSPDAASAPIELRADDLPGLLAGWLRELLFLHEVRGEDYVGLEADRLDERTLVGRILTRTDGRAAREIKGVTYHELAVTETDGRWRARVIFDV
jgi:SHS2 domain-containing protein